MDVIQKIRERNLKPKFHFDRKLSVENIQQKIRYSEENR